MYIVHGQSQGEGDRGWLGIPQIPLGFMVHVCTWCQAHNGFVNE